MNLPTDIPWERICVTEDMIDPVVCDRRLPAKWQTSLAAFKYIPDDEYQLFPQYKISYLKVTATITGYQPMDKEIQGRIDWNGVDATTQFTNEVLKDLLNSYHPCNGAILQVVVGPHGQRPNLSLKDYPFFMDFEPKKRELYELATDTSERSSRSIESLNITKSAGSTQSLEILDIDMGGGGFGVSGQGSYAGTGGGGSFNYTAPNGQWGTKRMNADESLSSRSSDVGQEKRETYSFSTQISQMYHLLDSYHLGTNRVVFFIQPRPHTLEEPSGFVRGPRPVDGIQEFFMVVAQPKDQDDFCVSLRLDTSHLTKVPILDYDIKPALTDMANAVANLPSKVDTMESRQVRCVVDYWLTEDDIYYKHFTKKVTDSVTFQAPDGYHISNYSDSINVQNNGSSNIVMSADRKILTINAEAHSSVWIQDEGDGIFADCPDELDQQTGLAQRRLNLVLKSDSAIKQIGEDEVLIITTRGLCCCSNQINKVHLEELVVGIKPIPSNLSVSKYLDKLQLPYLQINKSNDDKYEHTSGTCKECEDKMKQHGFSDKPDPKYTIRLANELSDFIKTETIKSLNDPTPELKKYYETDFFAKQLEYKLVQFNSGRKILNEVIAKDIPQEGIPKLEKHFGKKSKEILRRDLLSMRGENLAKLIGEKEMDVQNLKLKLLGVKFNPVKSVKGKDPKSKK